MPERPHTASDSVLRDVTVRGHPERGTGTGSHRPNADHPVPARRYVAGARARNRGLSGYRMWRVQQASAPATREQVRDAVADLSREVALTRREKDLLRRELHEARRLLPEAQQGRHGPHEPSREAV